PEMPTPILKARGQRARPVGDVTIEAVVRNEELRAGRHRLLIALVRILDAYRFDAKWKSSRKVFVVLHEPKAVASNGELSASALLVGSRGRRCPDTRGICADPDVAAARNNEVKHEQTPQSS